MGEPTSSIFSAFKDEELKENNDPSIIQNVNQEDQMPEEAHQSEITAVKDITSALPDLKNKSITDEIPQNESSIPGDLSKIKESITDLVSQFESKLKYDKHKDEIIDKLHDENQLLRNDLYKKLVLPFINEIIFIIDDYSILFRKHSQTDVKDLDVAKLLKQFGGISDDLENVLEKNGIEPFSCDGDHLDSSKQKIIKTIPTDDPNMDKIICERVKKGYIMEAKVIRQEQVTCYKYEKSNVKL
jgi:molecular chaperone GrpE